MSESDDLASAFVDQLYLNGERSKGDAPQTNNAPGNENGPIPASAELPPSKQKTADEVLAEMNKVPLFMTSLDEDNEDNEQLEALKALAYEGTRAEIADNFRVQGNECVKQRQYRDAREFYTKGLQALKAPPPPQPRAPEDIQSDARVVEIDDEEDEAAKERAIEEACHANRALCNLEMKNYGSCQRDCAAAIRLNPRNIKAWYRAASACSALDKIPEALDACDTGLRYESANVALKTLRARVAKRGEHLAELERVRTARVERERAEQVVLRQALKARGIPARTQSEAQAPDLEDAEMKLQDPMDATSTLSFPVVLLYPLHAQSDFVKAVAEDETLGGHLGYILPLPWDEAGEYTVEAVECYMETIQGGLIKAGKNMAFGKVLGSGKVEVVDGLVRVNVVPKVKASTWIQEWKLRNGKK